MQINFIGTTSLIYVLYILLFIIFCFIFVVKETETILHLILTIVLLTMFFYGFKFYDGFLTKGLIKTNWFKIDNIDIHELEPNLKIENKNEINYITEVRNGITYISDKKVNITYDLDENSKPYYVIKTYNILFYKVTVNYVHLNKIKKEE